MGHLNREAEQATQASRRKLIRDFNVVYAPIWSSKDSTTGMNRCVLDLLPGCSSLSQFRAIADPDQMTHTLADLDLLVITRAVEAMHDLHRRGDSISLVAPISYQTLEFDNERGELLNLLLAIPFKYTDSLILEITAVPKKIDCDTVVSAFRKLAPFAPRLVIEVNGRSDLVGPQFAGLVWGASWNLYGLDPSTLTSMGAVQEQIKRARTCGLETLAHGANTLGLAHAATEAGFDHVDGPAVQLYSTTPCAPIRLNPVRRKESASKAS